MKYLILGAGPAGLSLANKLKQSGEDSFLILEKESSPGGLCRSINVDGAPFDIGGGHFLDVQRPKVNKFLFQFMPEDEWNKFDRDSKIKVNENYVNHPIESNIWQMKIEDQVKYLKSIAVAGCNLGEVMPKDFVDWIYWKLGTKIAEDYMIPYNSKMFGNNLNQLGTYWLDKLPNVSFEETLLSCLNKAAYGTQPGHAQFFYPKKYGYGELWSRMADNLADSVYYDQQVESIDFKDNKVITVSGENYKADMIITTIPWTSIKYFYHMPKNIQKLIIKLKHSSIQTEYFSDNIDTTSHWIYFPDPKLSYHRILVRHNFCPGSNGYWTETNLERVKKTSGNYSYINSYAYPLNTIGKQEIMNELLAWCNSMNVIGLGRWGEHQHYNSDVTVEKALDLAEKLNKI